MSAPHKATPEQWAQIERFAEDCGYDACLLELRDRLAALEAAANHFPGATKMVPDPAGGLVERVAWAVDGYDAPKNAARAAILAVAGWFGAIGYGATASILRQEVERHG
jgi:hypothetical protein